MLLTWFASHDLLRFLAYITWDHLPGVTLPTVPGPFHILKNQENALKDTPRGQSDGGNTPVTVPFPWLIVDCVQIDKD